MMKTLKTVLVGVTGRARWALDLARPENGYQITALCDVNSAALETARAQAGLPPEACFTDVDAALRDGALDCMIICTPTRFHVPLAIKGLDAGLAVLTEKGMAPDWQSARRLVAHAKRCGGIMCVAQNYRYNPLERTVADCVAGRLEGAATGPVFCADLIHHRVRPIPHTLIYPFASVWDMSCHHFDSLMFLLGPPEAMTAHAFGAPWSPYAYPNNTSAHIEFRCGARVNYFHGHDSARGFYRLSLHGQFGSVTTDGQRVEFAGRPQVQFGSCPVSELPLRYDQNAEAAMLADFHQYVTQGIEPGISGRRNLEVMAMCQMMVVSATEQRRVLREELS